MYEYEVVVEWLQLLSKESIGGIAFSKKRKQWWNKFKNVVRMIVFMKIEFSGGVNEFPQAKWKQVYIFVKAAFTDLRIWRYGYLRRSKSLFTLIISD